MYRNVRVLHQPGPLRDGVKQDEGVSQCAVHLKPLQNIDEVSITRRLPEALMGIPNGVNYVEGLCP
jgi:hypothetical protein